MRKHASILKSFAFSLFCLTLLLNTAGLPAVFAKDEPGRMKLRLPVKAQKSSSKAKCQWQPNTLLVMPNTEKDKEDLDESINQVHGHVTRTIGEGPLTVWVVEFDNVSEFAEAEKKLGADKNFNSVQRDYAFQSNAGEVNDPYYASQWHLAALDVPQAWGVSQGSQNIIGVIDSGTNYNVKELSGKAYSGYDAVNRREGQSDVNGHGTMVATTAAANTNNSFGTAAPARLSRIYPVRAGSSNGSVSTSAILEGILKCGNSGVKIVNISANADPPYTFANKSVNASLHTYLKWFHDTKGGLIFNSAGNSGTKDNNARLPYLIVVSALDTDYVLADFSTYGNSMWFTAPGTNIYCSDRSNKIVSVAGTSFSSPLVASVAALTWGANPGLTNIGVENILKSTAYKASTDWTQWYGFGLPSAYYAVRKAKGL